MPEDNAAGRFWRALRALYLAAGKPTLQRLVHLGLEQRPPVSISHSTINGWLNARAVPTGRKNERYLTAMIAFLQAQVPAGAGYQRLAPGEWGRLLRAAQQHRAAGQRTGRPSRSGSRPAPGTWPAHGWHPITAESAVISGAPPGLLFGRDSELALLGRLVRGIATGQGGMVSVEGEPGIGKSALVQAALGAAAARGCQVFWGTGSELDEALPLQPVLEALQVREPTGNPRRDTIARHLRGETGADRGADGPAMLAEQLLALVAEESAARPTILVIDDLQWADQASIGLLARLASALPQLPLLLVVMLRPVPQREDLQALRRTAGDVIRLPLGRLAADAVTELVGSLAGGVPDARLIELARDAAGNPLYLTELVAALQRSSRVTLADGVARLTAGPTPRSLTAAIADRLGFIPAPTRELLRSASLLGPEFSVTDLAVLTSRSVADLAVALQQSCTAGVLTESGNRLKFRHPLIYAALYDGLPAPVRLAWHREAGRALAAAGAPADRVARQMLGAADGTAAPGEPMDSWMLSWLDGAAQQLVTRAPQVAATLLARAVASPAVGSAARGRLASHLADALYRSGERTAAAELASRELARDPEIDILVSLHWTQAECRIADGESTESLATLDRALVTPGLTARHRGRLHVLAARTHNSAGQAETAIRLAETGLRAAEEAGDTWATGWAWQTIAAAAMAQGRLREGLRAFDRGLAVVSDDQAFTDLRLLLQVNKAAVLANLDRSAEARSLALETRQLAEQCGTLIRQGQAQSMLAQLYFESGQWDDSLAQLARMPEGMRELSAVCVELGIAAVISFYRRDMVAASGYLAAAAPHAARLGRRLVPPLILARSLEHELAGALPAALSALTCWLDGSTEEVQLAQELVPDAVRLAVSTGDLDTAQRLAFRSAELAASDATPALHGTALYCRGLLKADPAPLLAAAEHYHRADRELLRARALDAAGLAYVRAGEQQEAEPVLASAAEIYAWLGARADATRIQASCSTA